MSTLRAAAVPTIFMHAIHIVLGSLFLALCAQVQIPLRPVPITLQTLGVMMLAISQGGLKAGCSVVLYLLEATIGLPVLAGAISNPLWMIGPRAGYLFSFPIAAYVVGRMLEYRWSTSLAWILLSLFCGEVIIYSMGAGWLSLFIGLQSAIALGIVPFIPTCCLKIALATSFKKFFSP